MKKIGFPLIAFISANFLQTAVFAQPEIVIESTLSNSQIVQRQIAKLSSKNPLERKRAAAKIGEYAKEAEPAIPFLVNLLGDSSECPEPGVIYNHIPLVYEAVEWTLIQIGTPSVRPLINVLEGDDTFQKSNAVYCLGRIRDKRAVEPLIKLLSGNDYLVKLQAIRALAELKDKRATEPLLKLLNDESLSADAIYALGEIADASAVDTLSFYLKDKNYQVRVGAVIALGKIGHKRATPYLIKALSSDDIRLKEYVILSLGNIGDPDAIEALMLSSGGAAKELQLKIIEALRRINDPKSAEALVVFLDNKDSEIRKNSYLALRSMYSAGSVFGEDSGKWKKWLNDNRDKLRK